MELPHGSGLPMMKIVAYAEWPLMVAAQIVKCLVMTVLWFGVSVHTASTCTVFSSGLTLSRSSNTAQCVDRNGSSRSDKCNVSPSPPFGFHVLLVRFVKTL